MANIEVSPPLFVVGAHYSVRDNPVISSKAMGVGLGDTRAMTVLLADRSVGQEIFWSNQNES